MTKQNIWKLVNQQKRSISEFIITDNNNITSEIHHRINMGNKCYYGLRNPFRSQLLRKDTKCKIYKTLIRPVVFYGCDSWTFTKTDEGKLSIFERKILRKIYGPSCVNGV